MFLQGSRPNCFPFLSSHTLLYCCVHTPTLTFNPHQPLALFHFLPNSRSAQLQRPGPCQTVLCLARNHFQLPPGDLRQESKIIHTGLLRCHHIPFILCFQPLDDELVVFIHSFSERFWRLIPHNRARIAPKAKPAMPSILQAMAVPDDAQYEEQNHNHNNGHIRYTNNIGNNHRNAHAHFHKHTQKKRQEIAVEDMPPQNLGNIQVTEVFQTTISIIEQINVDTNGNIIGTITYTTSEDTSSTSDTLVTVSSENLTPSATAIVPILPSTTSAKSPGVETSYPPKSSGSDTKSDSATSVPSSASEVLPILSSQTSILPEPSPHATTVPGVDNGTDETVVGVAPLVPTLIPGMNATGMFQESVK